MGDRNRTATVAVLLGLVWFAACDTEPDTEARRELAVEHEPLPNDRPIEVWSRTVTVHSDGTEEERIATTDDATLLARLPEITQPGFFDPGASVEMEDFSFSTDDGDGGEVHGTRVRIVPRGGTDPDGERAFREAAGMSFSEFDRTRDSAAPPQPTPRELLDADIAALEEQGIYEANFYVEFEAEPVSPLPRQHTSPVPLSALDSLRLRIEREERMVERGDEILAMQQPFQVWAAEHGATLLVSLWLRNASYLRASPSVAGEILSQDGVNLVRHAPDAEPDAVWKQDVVRDRLQTQHFIDSGYDGDRASSRNSNGLWIAVLDADTLDLNQGGFLDYAGSTPCNMALSECRVKGTRDCEGDQNPNCDNILDTCVAGGSYHGQEVAGVAAGDFIDGQPGLTAGESATWWSGHAQEAYLLLIASQDTWCLDCAIQQMMTDNVDVGMSSIGTGSSCNPAAASAESINDAFNDGILYFQAIGNTGACPRSGCTARHEAAAAGSIAAGETGNDTGTDIDDQVLCSASASGEASWGAVADLVAPSAPYVLLGCNGSSRLPNTSCGGTSFSNPAIGGAGANLMDYWIATYSDATAHQPGRMHAVMLNMGDGCGTARTVDGEYGTGRLRMRRYNASGMDSPWIHYTTVNTFSAAADYKYWVVFPDAGGANQDIPADVDALSTAFFCYYDGFDYADLPTFSFRVRNTDTGAETYAVNTTGEKGIVRINPADSDKYEIRLTIFGLGVSESVQCWVNWVFEDSARDDADGPSSSIDPYPVVGSYNTACGDGC